MRAYRRAPLRSALGVKDPLLAMGGTSRRQRLIHDDERHQYACSAPQSRSIQIDRVASCAVLLNNTRPDSSRHVLKFSRVHSQRADFARAERNLQLIGRICHADMFTFINVNFGS